MYGFYRLAAAVPELRVADIGFNVETLVRCYEQAAAKDAAAVVFPELSVTGYSCGDLFFQKRLLDRAKNGAAEIASVTAGHRTIAVFGLPLRVRDVLYNVAAVAASGRIFGIVPKSLLPNYREFYEKRHFRSGCGVRAQSTELGGDEVPFGSDLLFNAGDEFCFGVEICEDLWGVLPPSSLLALGGARAILNPSAGTELAAKAEYRINLVRQQSARCLAAYVLASAGVHESTSDVVFGGHALIAENGRLAAENQRFCRTSSIIYADIDFNRLSAARMSESSFNDNILPEGVSFRGVNLPAAAGSPDLAYAYNPRHPFVPDVESDMRRRCSEILEIQSTGLARRMEHTGAKTMVIGVSGGLDSTLALLAAAKSCRLLGRDASTIHAYTMPGFGTTRRTRGNAARLCSQIGATLHEVDIRPACRQHFQDIGHREEIHDTVYENAQARERTQILMDAANQTGGLVIGTGDLSEIALGWSTYNGDHMSMYAVNCSIPKTLIRFLIAVTAEHAEPDLAAVLRDIIATPVSPELVPGAADDTIAQRTEDLIGPYELHDFFLYHFVKYGAEPEKIAFLAEAAFREFYDSRTITRWLRLFLHRFFQQQFKRNCMPDGPKVGTIALSPRGDWRMPADALDAAWHQQWHDEAGR